MKNPRHSSIKMAIRWAIPAALAATATLAQTPEPTIRPTAQKVEGVAVVRKTTDLVIEAVSWAYNTPPASSERGAAPTERILQSPRLRITLRNAGTSVWASSGRLTALMLPGTPEELAAEAANRRSRSGVNVVEEARPSGGAVVAGMEIGSGPPFRGGVNIPGSLAPGQTRTFEIALEGKSRDAFARKRPLMKIDKFYTARVDIDAKGDDQLNNNGANLTFRLDASGQAVGPMFAPRATDPAARATVEVRAPGS